jgi:GNAT superfamily N-acetyltransferase
MATLVLASRIRWQVDVSGGRVRVRKWRCGGPLARLGSRVVKVQPLDVHDDRILRSYWQVLRDADAFGRPYAAFGPYDDMAMQLREDSRTREVVGFVALDGDQVLGGSNLVCPLLDNRHLAFAEPMVHPDFRNRGIGTAILERILEATRDRQRTTLIIEAAKPLDQATSPAWSFLRHRGFTPGILDLHRVLELPVNEARLDELAASAAPHHRDYRLVTWQNRTPEEWVRGVCHLQEAFNSEAPSGELEVEPEVWDEERLRDNEGRLHAMGRTETTTVAVGPEGEVVALTEMLVTEHGRGAVFQSGTLVLPAHRGHRLGIAIKVANLRRFQETFPEAQLVHSWNAEENGLMVDINDALGFRPVEYLAEMQRRL